MWKPMLPTLVDQPPDQSNWVYEVKYDGFRCGIEWTEKNIKLISRNQKDLTNNFPEIIEWCRKQQSTISELLPIFLDGEIAILRTEYQAHFGLLQQRGRLKTKERIEIASQQRPATFMAFDVLKYKNESISTQPLGKRREHLEQICQTLNAYLFQMGRPFNLVKQFNSYEDIEPLVFLHQGEGIVAKKQDSTYMTGKRTEEWLKIKNYRYIQGILTGWDSNNDYFDLVYVKGKDFIPLGKVKNGFQDQDQNTLKTFIQEHGKRKNPSEWQVPASVCLGLKCLDAKDQELREPFFHQFRFDLEPEEVTEERIKEGLAQLPKEVEISKPDKHLFPKVTKRDYVFYLRDVAPILLSRIHNKRLTMIRYPDGIHEHSFYQKHLPDYAPDFIQTVPGDDEDEDILCQDLRSLLWFGNHAALEFHIPFHTIHSEFPDEMVFDLDPPSRKEFSLAVLAAQLIKEMCEHKGFVPFVKTSGKTGLQVHIPLEPKSMTFEKTREFMEAVAKVLVEKYPSEFTIERLKKNRGNRLYVDYIQHAPGKTIVAPYSTRATEEATVATPLYWHEVNEQLDPDMYTIKTVPKRLIELGCPFLQMPNYHA
ncbi:DNA ligase D [Piscibacillus halophilus]|uniref:Bifunctional non-homologous end joining protein LigD n=1 Tax=Piscibacillus halophilus TaxID=571933 RepID=A0A1H9BBM6_9BACI|nr:DNA ligase D [Piscibacillus halophilus]SEP86245.1 bifunctional non-homologous end joining protein LigD [Piscibacillus halophilus]